MTLMDGKGLRYINDEELERLKKDANSDDIVLALISRIERAEKMNRNLIAQIELNDDFKNLRRIYMKKLTAVRDRLKAMDSYFSKSNSPDCTCEKECEYHLGQFDAYQKAIGKGL